MKRRNEPTVRPGQPVQAAAPPAYDHQETGVMVNSPLHHDHVGIAAVLLTSVEPAVDRI